jgi:hypothetical protein
LMCALNEGPARLATSPTTIMRDRNYNGLLRVRTKSGGSVSTPFISVPNFGGIFPH